MSGTYDWSYGPVKVYTASTEEPVTRNEIKTWLRIDEFEVLEDALLDSLVTRARQRFEEVTRRSVQLQTFDYYPVEWPTDDCPIVIPKAPLASVVAIKAFQSSESTDTGGTSMSTSGYYVDTATEFGRVAPLSAFTYPTATRTINPGLVRFTAGYSSGSSGVPEGVKTEIKQLVAAVYEHRGDEQEQARILEAYSGSEYALPSWG